MYSSIEPWCLCGSYDSMLTAIVKEIWGALILWLRSKMNNLDVALKRPNTLQWNQSSPAHHMVGLASLFSALLWPKCCVMWPVSNLLCSFSEKSESLRWMTDCVLLSSVQMSYELTHKNYERGGSRPCSFMWNWVKYNVKPICLFYCYFGSWGTVQKMGAALQHDGEVVISCQADARSASSACEYQQASIHAIH